MKQIIQSLRTGETEIEDIPCPQVIPGHVLIRTRASVISAGTERMLVEFGKANLLSKALQQPEKVGQAWSKVKTDGLFATVEAIRTKLDQPFPLGYSNAGVILEVGEGVQGFTVGDRVVSNGHHAEIIQVPKNLCAKIPDEVTDEEAAFAVIGAIGLQGIRLAQPTLGECFVVIGLGLIGLMTVQLLRAYGCGVLGVDLDSTRLALARQFGAEIVDVSAGEDPVGVACAFSRGRGVDGVVIAASTSESGPVRQAAQMCRKRGRIILVGMTGLELVRSDFYEKELTFQVSCSYGPGRYDPAYEKGGQDYPFGFVRWTARRNFEAVLSLMGEGRFAVGPLISHRFPFEQAEEAYKLLSSGALSLGILLHYPDEKEKPTTSLRTQTIHFGPALSHIRSRSSQTIPLSCPVLGFIGAGNFATQVLIPAFKQTGARLKILASQNGVSATQAGRRFGFEQTTTDTDGLFGDAEINVVVIATRHDSHAHFVCQALAAGKHVFVEKPLALTRQELLEIESAYSRRAAQTSAPLLMVGFNRRFAPQSQKMKSLLEAVREPKSLIMTVNAGPIPPGHWTQDRLIGGGRIIGEGCHFIDLMRFLVGHPIIATQVTTIGGMPGLPVREDKTSFMLRFADGSFAAVHYLANGHRDFPKERLEVFCEGRILQLDNFKRLKGFGWPGFKNMNLWKQDKGHVAEVATFIRAVQRGEMSPIPFEELVEVTQVGFDVAETVR